MNRARHRPAASTSLIAFGMQGARHALDLTIAQIAQAVRRVLLDVIERWIRIPEPGREASTAAADFLMLADVLQAPLMALVFRTEPEATIKVLPGRTVRTLNAAYARSRAPPVHGGSDFNVPLLEAGKPQ